MGDSNNPERLMVDTHFDGEDSPFPWPNADEAFSALGCADSSLFTETCAGAFGFGWIERKGRRKEEGERRSLRNGSNRAAGLGHLNGVHFQTYDILSANFT